jgi:imidazolonepropionase-like amidohydrolase
VSLDLILVNGDPLTNISDLRKVSKTVANGRVYDTAKLWRSVSFNP